MVQKPILEYFLFWIPQAIGVVLNELYWMQAKEYRWDRFWAFAKTKDGVRKLLILWYLARVTFALCILVYGRGITLYLLILSLFDFSFIYLLLTRKMRKPVFTQRAKRVLLVPLIIVLSVYIFQLGMGVRWVFIVLETALFVGIVLGVFLTDLVSKRILRNESKAAKKKVERIRPFVIDIAGSYGKSTTKEFISQILSKKYVVVKTPGTQNTHFGLVRAINSNLSEKTQILVAEMGAYKIGDIKDLCKIVKPNIAVVTGIESQHIELFGSMNNIISAKYEVVEALDGEGAAIFNLNNLICQRLYLKTKKKYPRVKVMGFYVKNGSVNLPAKITPDIIAESVDVNKNSVNFEAVYKSKRVSISSNLTGVQFVENLLCAVLVSRLKNVDWSDIKEVSKKVQTISSTMKILKYKDSFLVDDSHNSTPKGFEAAVNYLNLYDKEKKIVVTSGVIETGSKAKIIHKKLGNILDRKTDLVYVTNRFYAKMLESGFENKNKIKVVENPEKLVSEIDKEASKNSVFLIEGRMPSAFKNCIIDSA